nr:hypothetical protein BaRGS_011243 [Batillaria attramentaria]
MSMIRGIAPNNFMAEAQATINLYVKPGLGNERSVEVYDKTSSKYDEYTGAWDYSGPTYAARTMGELFPEQKQRDNFRFLDVAAGTGLVGTEMKKLGFQNLDALDPSKGMLDVARERGIYTTYYQDYIGDDKLDIKDDAYDSIVMCGGMGVNMVPCSGFREMIRIVRPGGYIVNVTRPENMENNDYIGRPQPMFENLEKEGHWKLVSQKIVRNYLRGKDGVCIIYQVQ